MPIDPNSGWGLAPIGSPTQSTMPLSPAQVQQIHQTTAAMQQPSMTQPSAPQQPMAQQNAMMSGLFGNGGNTGAIPNYGQAANATGLGAGTGGLSFPMFQ